MKGVKKLHLFPILIKKRTAIVNFNGTRSASGALTLPLARFYGTPVGEDSLLVLLLFFVDRISGAKPEPFQIAIHNRVSNAAPGNCIGSLP